MVARLTPSEARALGLPPGSPGRPKKTKSRRVAKGAAYHTVCVMCRAEFNTIAAENRHLNETGHPRYSLVLGYATEVKPKS